MPEPTQQKSTHWGVIAGAVVLLVLGLLVNRWWALPSFLIALIIAGSSGPFVTRLTPRMGRLSAGASCFLAVFCCVTALTFLVYPAWHSNAVVYVEQLAYSGSQAFRAAESTAELVTREDQPTEGGLDDRFKGMLEDGGNTYERMMQGLPERFRTAALVSTIQRLVLLGQFTLFLAGLQILFLFSQRPAVQKDDGEQTSKPGLGSMEMLSLYCLVRGLKGLALCTIAALGVFLGGVQSWLFLAGVLMLVGAVSGAGPIAFALLVVPAVAATPDWMLAGGAALGTLLLLLATEYKLYPYVVAWPVARWANLPRQAFEGLYRRKSAEGHAGSAAGGTLQTAIALVQISLSGLILVLMVLALLAGVIMARAAWDVQEGMRAIEIAMAQDDYAAAVSGSDRILEKYPSYRPALVVATESRALAGQTQDARVAADQFAAWRPPAIDPVSQPTRWLKVLALRLQAPHSAKFDRTFAYKRLLRLVMEQPVERLAVAARILEHDAEFQPALLVMAEAVYQAGRYEEAVAWATKGLEANADEARFYYWRAKAYAGLSRGSDARSDVQAYVRLGGDLSRAAEIRAQTEGP